MTFAWQCPTYKQRGRDSWRSSKSQALPFYVPGDRRLSPLPSIIVDGLRGGSRDLLLLYLCDALCAIPNLLQAITLLHPPRRPSFAPAFVVPFCVFAHCVCSVAVAVTPKVCSTSTSYPSNVGSAGVISFSSSAECMWPHHDSHAPGAGRRVPMSLFCTQD